MIAEYAAKSLRHADGLIKFLGRINWCPSGIHSNFYVHLNTAPRPNMTQKLKSPVEGHPSFEHIVGIFELIREMFSVRFKRPLLCRFTSAQLLEMVDQ